MPTRTTSLTLPQLLQHLREIPSASRDAAEADCVVPTPQQQSAARKKALLLRARELGIRNAADLPRHELTAAVNARRQNDDDDPRF